jgi:hypothetical protein
MQPSDDLCITFYCVIFSLLKNEEAFHTRDIDSSSWDTKPDHDVIMTLSALQTNLPLLLASLHGRSHQDVNCEFDLLPRPAQLNVLADQLAYDALEDLRADGRPTEFYPSPACDACLRDDTVCITNQETITPTNEFPQHEIRAYIRQRNNWTGHVFDSDAKM